MSHDACRGYGTIRPATPTDCRSAESIHRICHRPAARASKTHSSGLGPPWRSHPCIVGYPQSSEVHAIGMERSVRRCRSLGDAWCRPTVSARPRPGWRGLPERGVHTSVHTTCMDAYHAVFCIGLVIMTHNTPWLLSTSSPITNLTTHHHPPLGVLERPTVGVALT